MHTYYGPVCDWLIDSKIYAQGGAWTHDHEIRSLMLYQLKQPGAPPACVLSLDLHYFI